ncbi:MAG: cytidylyltransferase domain-containing protein [Nitrospinaceae bacterium]
MKGRTAAIIQARTGSTRYPNKALADLAGTPLTEHIIKRVQAAGVFDAIVLAIPDHSREAPLAAIADRLGVACFRGPEEDVLGRIIQAAAAVQADHVLRVCGDNPLIDIPLMRDLHREHHKAGADYTMVKDPIPLGAGTEMVRLQALQRIAEATEEPCHREHVTTYFHDHGDQFHIHQIPAPFYLRNIPLRLTVDTEADLTLLRRLYDKFHDPYLPISLEKIILYLVNKPELQGINAHIPQKDWRK